jgi:hypothetical protein
MPYLPLVLRSPGSELIVLLGVTMPCACHLALHSFPVSFPGFAETDTLKIFNITLSSVCCVFS